jgi:hypothetical protein
MILAGFLREGSKKVWLRGDTKVFVSVPWNNFHRNSLINKRS